MNMNKYIVKHKSSPTSNSGFSAVELIVTLFIAVLFLFMGYTLFGTIVTSGSQNRHRSQADNVAFDYLRRYESTVGSTCAASTPVNNVALTGTSAVDLGTPAVTVNITCPNGTLTALSLVKVTVTYQEGGSQRNVYHEVFASAQ